MQLTPRYGGPPVLAIEGDPHEVHAPLMRQRRRLLTTLGELSDDQWRSPSRCEGWTVQDVIAHLVGVDTFWQASVTAGLAGAPTTYLAAFDPAATPPQMVDAMRVLTPAQVLDQFASACDGYLAVVSDLDDAGWSSVAESPAGHVSIRLMSAHALWDCWIHERDIALPLALPLTEEPDELAVCLRYAAGLSPAFAVSAGAAVPGSFAVESTDPAMSFVLEVGGDTVFVRDRSGSSGAPSLRGPAVELIEALSFRMPLDATAPPEWCSLLAGLADVFDTEVVVAPA
jgi:uncharacterized protein (TIGR03083 family)